MKTIVHTLFLFCFVLLIASCATTHPNEALIAGTWKPVKAEKYFTEDEEAQLKTAQGGNSSTKPVTNDPKTAPAATGTTASPATPAAQTDNRGGGESIDASLDRLIRAESRANLIIYPDKTAVKFYRGRTVKATWKLRRNGTVFVARDLEKKDKYRIDILEVNETQMVVVENLPVGGIRIEYQKISEGELDEMK